MRIGVISPEFFRRAARNDATPISSGEATPQTCGNVGLIDGTARVDQPELLLYEPEKNGDLRLVAVEYIIPYTFHARSAAPPRLFNQDFAQNDTFQLWGLHAWVWKNNPSGMFASWNRSVTCENATSVMSMSQ